MRVQRCEIALVCSGNAEIGNEVQRRWANITHRPGNASTGRLAITYVASSLPRSAAGLRDDHCFIWVFSAPGRSFFERKDFAGSHSYAAAHVDGHSLQELVKGKRLPEMAGTHPLSPGKSGT
jgi:hypothetical protein